MSEAATKQADVFEPLTEKGVDYAIDIVSLNKSFKRTTLKGSYTTLKSSLVDLLFKRSNQRESYTTDAIKNLTMRIPRGASVGVIGRNGAGKSTFLKLLTGIYKPTSGKISVHGRVAALIELGAGFHPDFTGRENLYLSGIMHGLTRAQIDHRFSDIVSFAELESVIDDPVRTYSSGMFMRLGFSVAIHTHPDILLIDEVLAVGDAGFVAKCKDRIAEFRREGRTLVLVTHDLDAVERWCDEALWIHEGQVKDRGHPRRVIDHYREFLERGEEQDLREENLHLKKDTVSEDKADEYTTHVVEEPTAFERWGSREVEISSVRILDRDSNEKLVFHPDDCLSVEIVYQCNEPVSELVFGIGINRSDGLVVHGSNTDIERVEVLPQKRGKVLYQVSRLGLLSGSYTLDVAVHRADGYPYDYHKAVLKFAVRSPLAQIGVYVPEHCWRFYPFT